MSRKILVTGASGHLGQGISQRLLSMQIPKVIHGSRTPEKLIDIVTAGGFIRYIDFDNEESLDNGLYDVDTLLIVSTDALAIPGYRMAQHQRVLRAAQKSGVGRILYTSMPNPEISPDIPF